jgi:DNA primase small subunit
MYPRLDVNVSKHMNHLLKTPFSVHPKTGNVCVPFDAASVRSFSPFKVPTINGLHEELNDESRDASARHQYEGTSLEPYITAFKRFVDSVSKRTNVPMWLGWCCRTMAAD